MHSSAFTYSFSILLDLSETQGPEIQFPGRDPFTCFHFPHRDRSAVSSSERGLLSRCCPGRRWHHTPGVGGGSEDTQLPGLALLQRCPVTCSARGGEGWDLSISDSETQGDNPPSNWSTAMR